MVSIDRVPSKYSLFFSIAHTTFSVVVSTTGLDFELRILQYFLFVIFFPLNYLTVYNVNHFQRIMSFLMLWLFHIVVWAQESLADRPHWLDIWYYFLLIFDLRRSYGVISWIHKMQFTKNVVENKQIYSIVSSLDVNEITHTLNTHNTTQSF